MFCVEDFIRDKEKLQFTAAEITAGILHEIGHVFAYVEYLADFAYTGYYGNNPIRDLKSRLTKDMRGTINEVLEATHKQPKSESEKINQLNATVRNILTKISESSVSVTDDASGTSNEKFQYQFQVVMAIVSLLIRLHSTLSLLMSLPGNVLIGVILGSMRPYSNKSSKSASVTRRFQQYERLADEFVSRHGRSKDVNRLLMKIYAIYEELEYTAPTMYNTIIRDSYITRLMITILNAPTMLAYTMFGIIYAPISAYESKYNRFKRNISNLHDNLKDTSIPKELRLSLTKDIDQMEKDIKDNSTLFERLMTDLITALVTIPGEATAGILMNVLTDRIVQNDYGRLFEKLDELMSNKSFYYATKIGDITD
jgi:hypothetical protein